MDALRKHIVEVHRTHFGAPPMIGVYAPGCVELLGRLGEDQEGLALAAAADAGVFLALAPIKGGRCRVFDADRGQEAAFTAADMAPAAGAPDWAGGIKGIVRQMWQKRGTFAAFDATVGADLPGADTLGRATGHCLAAALVMRRYLNLDFARAELARMTQQALREFAGERHGLLECLAGLHGIERALLLIDFRTFDVQPAVLPTDVALMVFECGHPGPAADLAAFRARCETGLGFFRGVLKRRLATLRDVTAEEYEQHRSDLPAECAGATGHMILECDRARLALQAVKRVDPVGLGAILNAAHESARQNIGPGSAETDFIVATARETAGAWGALAAGNRVGALLPADGFEPAARNLAATFKQRFGADLPWRRVRPAAGARLVAV